MHDCNVSGISVRTKTSPVTLYTDSVRTEKIRTNKLFVFEDKIAIAKAKLVVQRNAGDRIDLNI